MSWVVWLGVVVALGAVLLRWGTTWGSTALERQREMPGDDYLSDGPKSRVAMTRAISVAAPIERVWP